MACEVHPQGTPPTAPATVLNGNGYIVIPRWFVSFLSFLSSVVFVGAVLWAWRMSNDVSVIKAEIKATNEVRAAELQDVRRRLDRHDALLDKLFHHEQNLP